MTDKSRRSPKQSRSKAVVTAILDATAHILLSNGRLKFTTNHIADRAGVSIGSLYQYFQNKEAIVDQLVLRLELDEDTHITRIMRKIRQDLGCLRQKSQRERNIRRVMEAYVALHSKNRELIPILNSRAREFRLHGPLRNSPKILYTSLKPLLEKVDGSTCPDNATRAFVLANSVSSLIRVTLLEKPDLFVQPKFVDQLVRVSVGYLES